MNDVFFPLAISIGLNVSIFLLAYLLKTDRLTDISYAFTFISLATYGLVTNPVHNSTLLAFSMVLLWALRIGIYLFRRIMLTKKDKRFDQMRGSFIRFLGFWLLQGTSVYVIMLPVLFLCKSAQDVIPALSLVGIAIYAIGLLTETIADYQKFTFKINPKNKDKWISSGLWKYSRHPNYLGEMLVWIGLCVYAYPHLSYPYTLLSLIGPAYIICLISFVSGIPRLEKSSNARWGKNADYQAYKKRTGILLPKLF